MLFYETYDGGAHEKEDVDDVWADTGLVGVSKNEKINDHIMSLLRY